MSKYIKLTITDTAAAWLETYRQSHSLKSTAAAILHLAQVGIDAADSNAPTLTEEWGGDRKTQSTTRPK